MHTVWYKMQSPLSTVRLNLLLQLWGLNHIISVNNSAPGMCSEICWILNHTHCDPNCIATCDHSKEAERISGKGLKINHAEVCSQLIAVAQTCSPSNTKKVPIAIRTTRFGSYIIMHSVWCATLIAIAISLLTDSDNSMKEYTDLINWPVTCAAVAGLLQKDR